MASTPSKLAKIVKFWVSVDSAFTAIVDILAAQETDTKEATLFRKFKFYAFRVPYGLEQMVVRVINNQAEETIAKLRSCPVEDESSVLEELAIAFTPTRQPSASGKGAKKAANDLESLIPNLMFVLATFPKANEISKNPLRRETPNASSPSVMRAYYMRDHTHPPVDGNYPPITISPRQMWSFIRLTASHDASVEMLPPDFPIKEGRLYKVIAGRFAGVVGHAQRVKGKDVVLVDLEGFGYVKSCFISKKLLMPVEEAPGITLVPDFSDTEHLTSANIHRLPQPAGDPRCWFVLETWSGRQHEVAATITYRQHQIIEARKHAVPLPPDAYYGLGSWPVIAIAPYSRKHIDKAHRPPNHIYLYATLEDAYALVGRSFRRDVAPDFPGERELPLRFKTLPSPNEEGREVPVEIPYTKMQNLLLLTRNAKEGIYKLPDDVVLDDALPEVSVTSGAATGVFGRIIKDSDSRLLAVDVQPAAMIAWKLTAEDTFIQLSHV